MRLRRAVITAVAVAGIVVPVVSTAAVASAGSSAAPISAAKRTAKPTKTPKAPKPVRFAASGVVTGVDAATRVVTLQSKVKGKKTVVSEVTVAANASIVVNGVKTYLSAVGPGQWIVVTGTRGGGVSTATKLVVKGKKSSVTPRPAPTPGNTPSATPTPTPSASPTDDEGADPDDDHGVHPSPHD